MWGSGWKIDWSEEEADERWVPGRTQRWFCRCARLEGPLQALHVCIVDSCVKQKPNKLRLKQSDFLV